MICLLGVRTLTGGSRGEAGGHGYPDRLGHRRRPRGNGSRENLLDIGLEHLAIQRGLR
jgi:hypothetical protein